LIALGSHSETNMGRGLGCASSRIRFHRKTPRFRAQAKNVIPVHVRAAQDPMDLFDAETRPEPTRGVRTIRSFRQLKTAARVAERTINARPARPFFNRGQCGMDVSTPSPHRGRRDDLCLPPRMLRRQRHPPNSVLMQPGSIVRARRAGRMGDLCRGTESANIDPPSSFSGYSREGSKAGAGRRGRGGNGVPSRGISGTF